MILLYHKISLVSPTMWWVTTDTFRRHVEALAGHDVVYLDDYDPFDPRHVVLTIDDGYECIYEHALPALARVGLPFEVFAMSDYVGRPNTFDPREPCARCCTVEQLTAIRSAGGRIQWHSRTHPHLVSLGEAELVDELTVPLDWRERWHAPHLQWVAYPYGEHNEDTTRLARQSFVGALSVHQGNDSDRFRWNRVIVEESTDLTRLLCRPREQAS